MKTQKNKKSVSAYINSIADTTRRADAAKLVEIMSDITKDKPSMWGDAIVGFGSYSYKRSTGKEYEWFQTGFSSRKNALSVYIMPGMYDMEDKLKKLGPHKRGVSCLYIQSLSDVHTPTLKNMIRTSVKKLS